MLDGKKIPGLTVNRQNLLVVWPLPRNSPMG